MSRPASRVATGLAAVVLAGLVGGCDHNGFGPKATGGAAVGAAGGGLAAAATGTGAPGIAAGVLLGGVLGGAVGDMMDERDRELAYYNTQESLEYGRSYDPVYWENPRTRNYGYVTPEPAYQGRYGEYCREYSQTIYIGGRPQSGYGTACRMPDGTWQMS